MKISIAIDGPSGCGKSTVAKEFASRTGLYYIDTGAMYRAIALYFLGNSLDILDENVIINHIDNIELDVKYNFNNQIIFLNGVDVTNRLRENYISQGASKVSIFKSVRDKLIKIQQKIAEDNNIIMDGRDIGTVVLPNAQLKIYLTASVEERANRRKQELIELGQDISYDKIKQEIIERDERDINRKISPLKKAEDAIVIDTSNISKLEVIDIIYKLGADKKLWKY